METVIDILIATEVDSYRNRGSIDKDIEDRIYCILIQAFEL